MPPRPMPHAGSGTGGPRRERCASAASRAATCVRRSGAHAMSPNEPAPRSATGAIRCAGRGVGTAAYAVRCNAYGRGSSRDGAGWRGRASVRGGRQVGARPRRRRCRVRQRVFGARARGLNGDQDGSCRHSRGSGGRELECRRHAGRESARVCIFGGAAAISGAHVVTCHRAGPGDAAASAGRAGASPGSGCPQPPRRPVQPAPRARGKRPEWAHTARAAAGGAGPAPGKVSGCGELVSVAGDSRRGV